MPALLIACPTSHKPLATGLTLSKPVLAATEITGTVARCPHCGAAHEWTKADAFFAEGKARRSKGDGAVYQFTDRHGRLRWRAVLDLGWTGGKRVRKPFEGANRMDVVRKLEAARRDLAAGPKPAPAPAAGTGAYLLDWLAGRQNLRESTVERYRQAIARLPAWLRDRSLADLAPEDLERAYRELGMAGMAPLGVLKVHRTVHAALARALRRGVVPRNVAALVDTPRAPKREVETLSTEQALGLLATARGDRLEALYLLAVATGMREGELLGLRWVDLDWLAPAVMVRGGLRRGSDGLRRRETKTHRYRRIALPPVVVEALRAHEARQAGERQRAGEDWAADGLVFPTALGTPMERITFWRQWRRLLKAAGLPAMPFKDASRHLAGSLLVAAGVDIKIVQGILGHSSITVTGDIYTHLLPGVQAGAMERMEAILRRVGEPVGVGASHRASGSPPPEGDIIDALDAESARIGR